jgi:23S rRNA-/tRNA-specific pseudouridylate synthase
MSERKTTTKQPQKQQQGAGEKGQQEQEQEQQKQEQEEQEGQEEQKNQNEYEQKKTLLDVLLRDEHLIAISKPHGLLVHHSSIASDVTEVCVQTLRDQIGQKVSE